MPERSKKTKKVRNSPKSPEREKRDLFRELMSGLEAMRAHREGRLTLRTHAVTPIAVPATNPQLVRGTRESLNMSRQVFALKLGVNPRTLERWEQGRSKPNEQAAALIWLVRKYPDTLDRLESLSRTDIKERTGAGDLGAPAFPAAAPHRRPEASLAPERVLPTTASRSWTATVNTSLNKHSVEPEKITLASGAVKVPKFSWRFRAWAGEPVDENYGGKAVMDCNGSPAFAELAILPILKGHGFDGAIWVDSYRQRFRDAMPPAVCALPPQAQTVYDRIATINGSRGGCWDVLAWNAEGVSFVECKRKGRDRMTASQKKWLESALKAGIRLDHFAVCEWEIE